MSSRKNARHQPPEAEQIRPEVYRKVHQRTNGEKSYDSLGPKEKSGSAASKVFWTIMVFFFISAAAYYLNAWITGGS